MKFTKGCFGYLRWMKKRELVRTIVYFALSGGIFIMGYLSTGTEANLLTIVAVLGCLPASKSAVSTIMYFRAGRCTDACYQALQEYADAAPMMYDLYLTSYQKNFQVSAMAIKNNAVCGYTEDAKCDLHAGEKHIVEILAQNGISGLTVKLFDDLSKFQDRLRQMRETAEKKEDREQAIAKVIKEISL